MNSMPIFCASNGESYTFAKIVECLKQCGAADCDILFVHTDIGFGIPAAGLKRNEYLGLLLLALEELQVENLIMPAFTYSFQNHECFDLLNSKTYMGALNDFFRKQPGVRRSLDPMLSVIMRGKRMEILNNLGKSSLGENSFFDHLHGCKNVKFLCFGADFPDIFTYLHYVEKMLDVPYRYDQPFSGTIRDASSNEYHDTWTMHTACYGVRPARHDYFRDEMIRSGVMRAAILGDRPITCVAKDDVYNAIVKHITDDINYFLEKPFTEADLEHCYQYESNESCSRIMHC